MRNGGRVLLSVLNLCVRIKILVTVLDTNHFLTSRHRMKQEDIIKFIKSQRLRWAAHVMRMENTRTTRKITEWMTYKTRPPGRPRLRWMDQVEEDLKRMKIIGWRAKVEDRQEWNRIVEQTKTHPGL